MSICDPDEEAAIEATAMRLLARREHSRLELKNKLENRGFEEIAVSILLDKLETVSYTHLTLPTTPYV